MKSLTRNGKWMVLALVCVLFVGQVMSLGGRVTGYDISLEYGTREEAVEAVEGFEKLVGEVDVTGVFNNTVTLYTWSHDVARRLMSKRDVVSVEEVEGNVNGYYTYETMTSKLMEWNETRSNVFRLFSLGKSVQGRELWAVELSLSGGDQREVKPNVKYIGNMHGDEVVGRELLMSFISTIVNEWVTNERIMRMISNMNIYIVPTMNPDGFALGTRGNANRVDLNRNFPDQYRSSSSPRQTETQLIIQFLNSKQWTLSANFHGGDLVANYPWDGRPDNIFSSPNPSPDDDVFISISKTYASLNPGMMSNRAFQDGITNGAGWYVLFGGMQDFNYIHHGCLEITLEVSMVKWPAGSSLGSFWTENRESMFAYLERALGGARGQVFDAHTGLPLANVNVTTPGREVTKVRTRKENGAFFRILPSGTWFLDFHLEGYLSKRVKVQVPEGSNQYATTYVYMERNEANISPNDKTPLFPIDPAHIIPPSDIHPISPPSKPAPSGPSPVVSNPSLSPSNPPSNPPSSPSWNPIYVPYTAVPYKTPTWPLISTSDGWVVPMFAFFGAFAAVALILTIWITFQRLGINIAGPISTSAGSLPSASGL